MAGRAMLELVRPEGESRVTRQLVMPVGVWHHPVEGTVNYSPERVRRYHDLYRAGVRQMRLPDPPGGRGLMVSELHNLGGRAHGYLYEPELTEQGIVASIYWTDAGLQGIRSGELCHLSPEILPTHLDPRTGRIYRDVWNGVGQVSRGFMDLPTIDREAIAYGDQQVGLIAYADPETLHMDLHEEQMESTETAVDDQHETATEGSGARMLAVPPAVYSDAERIEILERELAVERAARLEAGYREELRACNYGDPQQPLRLAPVALDPLAAELATLEAGQARRILDLVKGIRLYPEGAIGYDDPIRFSSGTEAVEQPLSAVDRAAMAAAGLTEEQYRAGMNRAAR